MKKIYFYIIAAIVLLMVSSYAVGYKVALDRDRELTPDEAAAAEVTRQLKEERKKADEVPDVSAELPAGETGSSALLVEEPEEETLPAYSEEKVYQSPTPEYSIKRELTSDEIWEMTRIVYLENGICYPECSYYTVYLTACVILNRLYDWDYDDVYEVIWAEGQYSTANRYTDYDGSALGTSNPDGWAIAEQAVYEAIASPDRNPHFQSTGVQGEVYYVDPVTGEVFCY